MGKGIRETRFLEKEEAAAAATAKKGFGMSNTPVVLAYCCFVTALVSALLTYCYAAAHYFDVAVVVVIFVE